ncbi:MAG TPA: aromatic-ring-hydroxylating dioxygenase subunit beta [Burkholderiales bacterium]|jgi:3-phenylpropionate/cinnamic acid dioxygenase small subunit|nr:aromatic-ring-hydroxylating dioxygenase subunit beta [Burkholderiales bacterium]
MYPGYEMTPPDAHSTRELRLEIEEFHAQYCWTLDCGDVERWPEYFTDDAVYRITARENADAGLPVGLVYADSKAMIRDRAFAIKHTQMYAPRSMQHFVTNVRVLEATGASIKSQSNYLLLQTLVDGPTTIHQAGRYYDSFVRSGGKLLLKERQCVYDTVLIANDVVLPV